MLWSGEVQAKNCGRFMRQVTVVSLVILCTDLVATKAIAQNSCERRFVREKVVSTQVDRPENIVAADMDGDGDIDIVSASFGDDMIAWHENTNGHGTFSTLHVISTEADGAWSVFTADLDGDGDQDVLSASTLDNKVAWYRNVDGLGSFGPQQIIATGERGAISVYAADLDNDNDLDVICAAPYDNKVVWFENTDGMGTFGPERLISNSEGYPMEVAAADLDGDGDQDVLSATGQFDRVWWFENLDAAGNFGPAQRVGGVGSQLNAIFPADVDGDGDVDVVAAAALGMTVGWLENVNGFSQVVSAHEISREAYQARDVFAADLDGDGDLDVLSASEWDSKVSWYENVDGSGSFGAQHVIAPDLNGPITVCAADFDGDGDIDVATASLHANEIWWFENDVDCNGNGINDGCDLADGLSFDCNHTGRPDECDIADGRSEDCNQNGVPDECDPGCKIDGTLAECLGVPCPATTTWGLVIATLLALAAGTSVFARLSTSVRGSRA